MAALGSLVLAAPAAGSTVEATTGGPRIVYRAAPGESNRVRVDRNVKPNSRPDSEATSFTVEELPGRRGARPAPIAPRGDCRYSSGVPGSSAISCPVPRTLILLELGDRDDRVDVHTTHLRTQAEADNGDDTLVGGWAVDVFYGERGDDTLYGGRGDDILWGDNNERERGNDVMIDRSGDNQMSGLDGRDNFLDGNGDSRLFGGDGNDGFRDEGGRDRIDADAGDDTINARDGERDDIRCGRGRDRAIVDRGDDARISDCEAIIIPRGGR
jgi:RTX calcium-binding nonapeptide repeat (4 copies)